MQLILTLITSKNAFDKELKRHYIRIVIDVCIIAILIVIGNPHHFILTLLNPNPMTP